MIDHIKQDSKSNLKKDAKKVDTLFGNTKLSFTKQSGDFVYFTHDQDLARGIVHGLRHQHVDILETCFKIQFSCTIIYPSLNGKVAGLNMDKLFTMEQLAPTTTPFTTGSDTNLASIATSKLTISSKNHAKLAEYDNVEIINYNNTSCQQMPKNIVLLGMILPSSWPREI